MPVTVTLDVSVAFSWCRRVHGMMAVMAVMALTANLIVRQQIILVGFLKHFQTQYIERPLIGKVLFQGSDFLADGYGTYDGSVSP